jgi:hypothetical protein
MSRLSKSIYILILIPLLAAYARGQETSAPEADEAKDKQAFELLNTISESISGLRASENRIYLTSIAADLLWDSDEKRARALFDTLTKEIVAAISAASTLDQEAQFRGNAFGMIQQQRREIMERMAQRDPDMALAFLRATRLSSVPESFGDQHAVETELELQLAGLIAAKDPAQALRMARSALRRRVTYGVVQLISQLDQKDRTLAQALHLEVLDRLKAEDLLRNYEDANAAWSLLSSYQPPQAKEETYRQLIELLTDVVLSIKTGNAADNNLAQNHYYRVQTLIDQVDKYAPGRAAALRRWRHTTQQAMDPNARWNQELNDLAQSGTVDQILALTNKLPAEYQSQVYERAAWKAFTDGDVNRARQLVFEFVKDPAQRRNLLEQFDNQSVWNNLSQNKIAEARQMLSRVKNVEQRMNMLMSMASNVSNRGDKKQAIELLDEARTLLASQPTDANRMMIRLQLAQNYSTLDSEQSAALVESVIVRLNELVAAAAVLDGFEQHYLKDGEWVRTQYSALGNVINNLDQSLGQLARVDLAAARRLSDQLERLEIRLMAQMAIAQALLAGRPQRHSPINRRSVQTGLAFPFPRS